jgi:hypothetical protein
MLTPGQRFVDLITDRSGVICMAKKSKKGKKKDKKGKKK